MTSFYQFLLKIHRYGTQKKLTKQCLFPYIRRMYQYETLTTERYCHDAHLKEILLWYTHWEVINLINLSEK